MDLVIQTPHGFSRIQVKTCHTPGEGLRVRSLGCSGGLEPRDRYDTLAVVRGTNLWLIPASVLDGKDTITIHTQSEGCPYAAFRKR